MVPPGSEPSKGVASQLVSSVAQRQVHWHKHYPSVESKSTSSEWKPQVIIAAGRDAELTRRSMDVLRQPTSSQNRLGNHVHAHRRCREMDT
jgi:hypothetical protein